MNLSLLIRSALAVGLAVLVCAAGAQNPLEFITLRHSTAEQVLPSLRPLLEPGATLTGQRNQLIVRTSPQNLAELRQALDAIDRPSRRLQLSVRFDGTSQLGAQGIVASGRVGERSSSVDVRAYDQRASANERVDQRIQLLEGSSAFIQTGQSSPVFDGTLIRENATGFDARPRLAGSSVLIDIAPRREAGGAQFGAATTLSAQLGEWIEVGAVARRADAGTAARRVWLKVEEVP